MPLPHESDTMSRPDPHEWFPQFYANPAIGALAPACRWTISGRLGEDGADQGRKAPVDVRHMLAGCTPNCRHEGPLRGAFRLDSTCLMDLDELTAADEVGTRAVAWLASLLALPRQPMLRTREIARADLVVEEVAEGDDRILLLVHGFFRCFQRLRHHQHDRIARHVGDRLA